MSERYDAGLLNDYGGGDVNWWHDYIRAELGRSEEFYADEIDRLRQQNEDLMVMVHGESEKVSALTARCAELEKALARFAVFCTDEYDNVRDRDTVLMTILGNEELGEIAFEHFRRARATLQGQDNG